MFSYCPSAAVPVTMQVIDTPTANSVCGQITSPIWSSVTSTAVRSSVPTLVTT
jgi:glycerol dehydrogenase-like iron-containing ADH family enzyme